MIGSLATTAKYHIVAISRARRVRGTRASANLLIKWDFDRLILHELQGLSSPS